MIKTNQNKRKNIDYTIQVIQNKVLRIIYKPLPLKTSIKNIHRVANMKPIHENLEKQIANFLKDAQDNQTIQDEFNLLTHMTHRAAHKSIIDQINLL